MIVIALSSLQSTFPITSGKALQEWERIRIKANLLSRKRGRCGTSAFFFFTVEDDSGMVSGETTSAASGLSGFSSC